MISDAEVAGRLVLAAVLGAAIGFERERLLWAAGLRTHMLVCVGSCLVMIVSAHGFAPVLSEHVILDPSRIAAQVVSGIGFLGAGAILLRGQVVRGLTTAASIWAVAAVGLAAGSGLYFASVASTVILLVILAGVKPIEDAYRARVQSSVLEITTEPNAIAHERLKKLLGVRAGQIRRVVEESSDQVQRVQIALVRITQDEVERAAERLKSTPGVLEVEVRSRHKATLSSPS